LKKSAKDDKQREADRLARRKLFGALLKGLAPWQERFAADPRLAMIAAGVEILDADDPVLPERISAAAGQIPEARLLLLFVHQRLEEIREPEGRAEALGKLAARRPLGLGMDRELLAALNASARDAVQAGDYALAERWWREGLKA